jgi:GT2 family glycosyltransferase
MNARILVSIVSYNSALHLKACFESLRLQTFQDFSIAVWDNASTDDTAAILESYRDLIGFVHLSNSNIGFCAGHNQLIASIPSDYVLVLKNVRVGSMVNTLEQGVDPASFDGVPFLRRVHSDPTMDVSSTPSRIT